MKIYTRTGDTGETSLLFGARVPKDDLRVEAYGTTDEANSALGMALAAWPDLPALAPLAAQLATIQQRLFHVGAELASPEGKRPGWTLEAADLQALEDGIDAMEAQLPPLRSFLLPGGHPAGAALHLSRTVVRRAERQAVHLGRMSELEPLIISYLNRLSDYLFVAARFVNTQAGTPEQAGPAPKALAARPEA